MGRINFWMQGIKAPFLSLSVVLVFLGTAVGLADGSFFLSRSLLALLGLLLVHASVNLLNEYSDFRTGIDFHTTRTPFSEAVEWLIAGSLCPRRVWLHRTCRAEGPSGCFMWSEYLVLPLLLNRGSPLLLSDFPHEPRWGSSARGGTGLLPILGASFIQTGYYSPGALGAGIPAGILTLNLLLLNEFPDLEADLRGGRKNLLTLFGKDAAGKIYTLLLVFMYIWIVAAVVVGIIPVYCLVALLTLVIALRPMAWAWKGGRDMAGMIPALSHNIVTNLVTQVLLGVGFICSVYV